MGTVIDVDRGKNSGRLMITEPAIEARLMGDRLRLGQEVLARLTSARLCRRCGGLRGRAG